MLRTLGFLSGVGISIAGLLLVLEPADLQRLQTKTTAALAKILPLQRDLAASSTQQLLHAAPMDQSSAPIMDTAPQQIASTTSGAELQAAAGEHTAITPGAETPPQEPTASAIDPPPVAPAEQSDDIRSHLFWNPFRSELAAQGFAGRLSTATDVTVMVMEAGPASYRVGFGYRDEAERRALIEQIESVTGLELE